VDLVSLPGDLKSRRSTRQRAASDAPAAFVPAGCGGIEEIECEFDRPQLVGRKKLFGSHRASCEFVKIITAGTQKVTGLIPPLRAARNPFQLALARPTRFEIMRRSDMFHLAQLTSEQQFQSLVFTFTGLSVHLRFLLKLFDFFSQPGQHATASDVNRTDG